MGQQQLLLLVLAIVIVGLAVVTGIEAFGENAQKAKYDRQVAYMAELAARVETWNSTLPAMGGNQGRSAHLRFSTLGLPHEPSDNQLLYREGVGCLFVFPTSSNYYGIRVYDLEVCPASRTDLAFDDVAFIMRVYDDHWRFYHMHGDSAEEVRVEW